MSFDDMIEACNIFKKYTEDNYPFCAEHDIIFVGVEYEKVTDSDKKALDELGFQEYNDSFCCYV